jgi:nitrous oxide reductase accessory protein NosL
MKSTIAAVSLLLFLVFAACGSAGEKQPVKPAAKDKCPVCGMFVAKYPDFLAQVLYKDGHYAMFDGVKDMFKYLFAMEKYEPSRKKDDIVSVYVTDYYALTPVDGYKAFYVEGSNVFGPMGRELIPFGNEEDAREFMVDHMGKSLHKFDEITPDIIKGLD